MAGRGGYYDLQGRWRESSPITYKISRTKLIEALKESIEKREDELKEKQAKLNEQNMAWPAKYLQWAKKKLEEAQKEVALATKATKFTNANALTKWWNEQFSSVNKGDYTPKPTFFGTLQSGSTGEEIAHIKGLVRRLELSDEVDIQGTEVDDFMKYV